MITMHLVILNGGGDTEIAFVTAEQWAWIHSAPPADYLEKGGWQEKEPGTGHKVDITCGSYENDRAIYAVTYTEPCFETTSAARKYAAKQPKWIVSDDEYHGYLY